MISSRITIDSMRTIAERLPDRPRGTSSIQPQSITYDYDMAYPQNTGESQITIYNPKLAHYVAGVRPVGDETMEGFVNHYVPGKERWLDVSIFPPRIETVPPTETNLATGLSASRMHIYKGFQFDFPFSELWATPPARMAMVANAWASWNMMIALTGDISEMFFGGTGAFLDSLANRVVDSGSFGQVWTTVNTRDRIATINSMYDVFIAVLPAIEDQMKDTAEAYYGDLSGDSGILPQITTIFDAVWNLVSGGGIVNSIIDLTTQVIPFYYDLFTAHSYAIYPVFDSQIESLPNSPTISRAMPRVLTNGRIGIVYGFDFGSTPGQVLMVGGSGAEQALETIVWETGSVSFRMPENEKGVSTKGTVAGAPEDEPNTVFLTVEKSDGTRTNTVQAPYKFLDGSEEGGGGCTVGSSAEGAVSAGLLFALLFPLVLRGRMIASRPRI